MPVRKRHYAVAAGPAADARRRLTGLPCRPVHKEALADAELRDMPLHSLRHTAAAACSLRELADVRAASARPFRHPTTERYYGHLERHVWPRSVATEEAIARAYARR